MGSGAVGTILAFSFRQLGFPVSFIDARQPSSCNVLRVIEMNRIELDRGHFASLDSSESIDIVIVAVRLSSGFLHELADLMDRFGKADFLLIQNGIGMLPRSHSMLDYQRIFFGSVSLFQGSLINANVVNFASRSVLLRTTLKSLSSQVSVLGDFQFESVHSLNSEDFIWEKFVRWAPMSIVCGLHGLSIGEVLASPELCTNLAKLVEEHEAIAESLGFILRGDTMTQIKSIPGDTFTSAARSISSGQSSELDTIYSWAIEREVELGPETRLSLVQLAQKRKLRRSL